MTFREAHTTARRHYGIPAFERGCRLADSSDSLGRSRRIKAWKVPATPEHGTHSMLTHRAHEMVKMLRAT